MRHFLTLLILPLLIAACGGGAGTVLDRAIPDAHAADPVSGCPIGDATDRFQAMVDSAKNGRLDVPACTFNLSRTITIRDPLRIVCSNPTVNGTIFSSSADEAMVMDPGVRISVLLGWEKRGWEASVENCRFQPVVSGGGRHGLVWRVRTGYFISSSSIKNNHFGGFSRQGLYLDNSAGNLDGIFTTTVEKNFIENGVLGVNLGDSVHFIDNVVPDGVNKPGLPGFDLSFVPGAAESALIRNNVTTSGGCFLIRNGTGIGLLHNWCESAGAGASVGLLQLNNCAECTVRDNRVQTLGGNAPYALAINGGELNVIDSNKFNVGKAGHISFANTKQNRLTGLNRFIGEGDVLTGKILGGDSGLVTNP